MAILYILAAIAVIVVVFTMSKVDRSKEIPLIIIILAIFGALIIIVDTSYQNEVEKASEEAYHDGYEEGCYEAFEEGYSEGYDDGYYTAEDGGIYFPKY